MFVVVESGLGLPAWHRSCILVIFGELVSVYARLRVIRYMLCPTAGHLTHARRMRIQITMYCTLESALHYQCVCTVQCSTCIRSFYFGSLRKFLENAVPCHSILSVALSCWHSPNLSAQSVCVRSIIFIDAYEREPEGDE